MTTTNVISTPNIEGNIGSCEVKTTEFRIDITHQKVIATNSCTGQIVEQHEFYDPSMISFAIVGIVFIAIMIF